MPPVRPDFLPANRIRRQQLDPTRQLTSRELWNQVRFHSTPNPSNNATPSGGYYQSLIRAILYEIQPFRVKPVLRRARTFVLEEDGFKQSCTYCMERIKSVVMLLVYCMKCIFQLTNNINAKSIKSFIGTKLFRYSIITFASLYTYGRFLVYMHRWLHAGPMVFIITLLILIYTIGLGENTGASSGVPSAYSVFNRGVQRLIGQEDAETLANQFVRAAVGHGFDAAAGRNQRGFGQIWIGDDEPLENNVIEEQEVINERRRRRRLERLQQRNRDEGYVHHEIDNNVPQDEIVEAVVEPEDGMHQNNGVSTTTRKSGKKARRRNLEVRREMQRQRQAAAAMGFGDDGGVGDMREMNAIDQLIED